MKRITILLVTLLFAMFSQSADANGTLQCNARWARNLPITLVERNVTVYTENGLAFMELEDTFQNGSDIRCEGVYRFRLPVGGFTSGFWINTDGKTWVKGEIKEITQARKIYHTITSRMVDPGLLEQQDGEVTIRVFPIEAGKKVGIRFRFFFPETGAGTKCRFEFPVGFDVNAGVRKDRFARPGPSPQFKFIASFKDTDGIRNLSCNIPEAKIDSSKNTISCAAKAHEQTDLVVSYELESLSKTSVSAYQLPTGKKLSLIRLSNVEMAAHTPDSTIALIVDQSGSMGPKNKARAINACKIIEGIAGLKAEIFAMNELGIKKTSLAELQAASFYGATNWSLLDGFVNNKFQGVVLITDAESLRSVNLKTLWEKVAKKPVWLMALGQDYDESISCMAEVYGGATFVGKTLDSQEISTRLQSAIRFLLHSPSLFDKDNRRYLPLFGSLISRAYYVLPFQPGDYSARDCFNNDLLRFTVEESSEPNKASPWFVNFAARQQIRTLEAMDQTPVVCQKITELGLQYSQATDYTAFLAVPDDIARANADVMNPQYLAMFAAPNFRKSREQARSKACFANQRVLLGAIEMYNMDNVDMDIGHNMENGTFDMDRLVEGKYLRSHISKPTSQCDYRILGDITGDGFVLCVCHGTVEEIGVPVDELVAKYCEKNKLNPDDFDIPDDLFATDQYGTGLDHYMKKMEPIITLLSLLL